MEPTTKCEIGPLIFEYDQKNEELIIQHNSVETTSIQNFPSHKWEELLDVEDAVAIYREELNG